MKKYRLKRYNEILKHEISDLIFKELKDPRIKGMITVTEVDVAADAKSAKIYVSIFGVDEKESKKVMDGLKSAEYFIKHRLLKNLRLRYAPNLFFIKDESIERGVRIINKLTKLNNNDNGEKDEKRDENL